MDLTCSREIRFLNLCVPVHWALNSQNSQKRQLFCLVGWIFDRTSVKVLKVSVTWFNPRNFIHVFATILASYGLKFVNQFEILVENRMGKHRKKIHHMKMALWLFGHQNMEQVVAGLQLASRRDSQVGFWNDARSFIETKSRFEPLRDLASIYL